MTENYGLASPVDSTASTITQSDDMERKEGLPCPSLSHNFWKEIEHIFRPKDLQQPSRQCRVYFGNNMDQDTINHFFACTATYEVQADTARELLSYFLGTRVSPTERICDFGERVTGIMLYDDESILFKVKSDLDEMVERQLNDRAKLICRITDTLRPTHLEIIGIPLHENQRWIDHLERDQANEYATRENIQYLKERKRVLQDNYDVDAYKTVINLDY